MHQMLQLCCTWSQVLTGTQTCTNHLSHPTLCFPAAHHQCNPCLPTRPSPAQPLPALPPSSPCPGEIPDFASRHLSNLDLSFNKLSGPIPDGLGAHPSLVSFEAKGNQLTSLPSAWQRAPGSAPVTAPLSYVRLSSNPSLGGGFPVGLANYPNLTLLLLSENRLRWAGRGLARWRAGRAGLKRASQAQGVPAGAALPTTCTTLLHGRYQGLLRVHCTTPPTVPPMPRLTPPSCSPLSPCRSGPLPNPTAGQFPKLRFLDLDGNQFSGTIGEGWQGTGIFQLVGAAAAAAVVEGFD